MPRDLEGVGTPAGARWNRPDRDGSGSLEDFAGALADAARCWHAEGGFERILDAVVRSATVTVPGVCRASITMIGPKQQLRTVAQSDGVIGTVDRLQYELGEGPSIDIIRRHDTVHTGEVATDPRWPALGPKVSPFAVRSLLCVHLYVLGTSLGALNLASHRAAAFDEDTERLGLLFGAHAAVALDGSRLQQDLHVALAGRDVIGQAKGILMQRHRVSAETAFTMLVTASQETNIRVREVAKQVVERIERRDAASDRRWAPPEAEHDRAI
jgi:hypothetical protein